MEYYNLKREIQPVFDEFGEKSVENMKPLVPWKFFKLELAARAA